MTDVEGRVALVTGASRGIGFAVAVELARRGVHIIAVARTEGGLTDLDDAIREAGGAPATLVPLDLRDMEGIDRLGGAIFERWKKLDMLVGNAGLLGTLSPLSHIDPKDWSDVMTVNVSANYRLIRATDALLRQSDAGRAVFITSGVATQPRAYWGNYSVSKSALEMLAKTYAAETEQTDIRVNLFSPGPVRTAMRAKAMPGEDPEKLPQPSDVAGYIADMVEPGWSHTGVTFDYRSKSIIPAKES